MPTPALAKNRSIAPNASSAARISATLPTSLLTSAARPRAVPGRIACSSPAVRAAPSPSRSATTTDAPAAWNRCASPLPMPPAAPVTTT